MNFTTANSAALLDLNVKIGATTASNASTYVSDVTSSVYTSASFSSTVGVNTFTFTAPFYWNGTSNIVLDFCYGNASTTATNTSVVALDNTAYVSSNYYRSTSAISGAVACASNTLTGSYSARPQFKLVGQTVTQGVGTLAYTWNDPLTTTGNVLTVSPATTTAYTVSGYDSVTGCTGTAMATVTVYDLPTAPSVTSAIQCGTRVPLVSVADTNGYTTPTFKWYADNVTTTALQTSTSTTYTTSVSTTTTFFVSVVSPGGCESPRAEVTTTVVAPATLAVSPAVAICTGGNTTLTASGAVSYTWTPALGLNGTTSASVIASPSATTTYSVTGIDGNGCTTAAATVVVTVNPYPTAVTATASSASVCQGATINLTASAGGAGGGLVNFSEGFETFPTLSTGWTFLNPGSGNIWGYTTSQQRTGTYALAYGYDSDFAANTWALTPAQNLTAGVTYTISYWYRTSSAGGVYAENLKLTVGTLATVAGQTTTLLDQPGLVNETFAQATVTYTPSVTGTYYFGLNCYSDADKNLLSVDDFTITGGSAALPLTYAWTSTPSGFTSTDQNPTGVVVSEDTTYTVTASIGSCGTSATTTTVATTPLPTFSLNGTTTICNGQTTSLTATGSGYDYAWSPATGLSATTGSLVDANPTATTTYTVVATETATGCHSSQMITVTVIEPGAINPIGTTTSQIAVPAGTTTFTVATASGATYSYQWQVNDGTGWSNLANDAYYDDVTTATLTLLDVQIGWDGYQYQCLVTGASPCATLTPIVATLTVSDTGIATQPASVTLCATSSTTSFTIVTNGDEPYGIQWQMSTDDGFSYADVAEGLDVPTGLTFSGVDTKTLGVSGITLANTGYKFICVLNFFLPSDFATLTVKQPVAITADPSNQTVCVSGGTATFSTTATGEDLTYQWQFSTNGGTSWSNYVGTGATTASIAILNPALGTDGYQYHVIVSGNAACSSATSASATLNINNPTITSQPAAATVLAGNTATFTVAASAATGYQWEYSTNGSTGWAAVADATPTGNTYSGATSATLSVVTSDLTAAGAANYYRCVVTDTGCTVTSNGAQMTVVGYCIPAPSSVDGDGITNVTMGDINNETLVEAGNYGNYSAQSTTATQSSTVNFAITYGTGYTYGTKIWIDFNNNGVFTDPAEQVYFGLSTDDDPTTLLGSFNLAADAPLGSHRLRIGGTDNDAGPSTPCYTGAYGTFEDYTINIIAAPACSGAPTAGVASAASASLCAGGSTTLSLVGSTSGVTGISYQWYSSADNVTFAPVSGETTTTLATGALTADAYYYAVVTCANGGLTDNSNTVTITVSDPQITGSTPAAICGTGTAVLAATANAGSTINWYTALTGGTSLYTGASFTTPSIATTTTYYAEAVSGGGSGNASTTYTGSTNNGTSVGSHGIAITTSSPSIKIVSADIPFTGTGTFTVSLKDATNTTVISSVTTGSVTGSGTTAVTVPLNITVPTAGNYLLMITAVSGSVGALGYSTVTYPATALSGAFSVTGGYWYSVGTSNMYLYNLNVSNGCSSTRTAVTATVDPKPTATISYAGSPYCYNAAPVSVTLNGTNAYTGGTFTASPAGLSIDGTTGAIDPSLSTDGTYTITYTTNATTYCTPQTATATVTVNPSVLNAGFTYASATYCTNSATASPTITGFAGTFTASPAGLSINATTGAIAFATSTPGSYTVTNTVSACSSSDVVTFDITVNQAPVITTQPASATVCPSANASFTVAASGTGVTYQWEENTGSGWATIVDAGVYSNATTATLSITGATVGMNAYQYRAIVSDTSGCGTLTSGAATLTISQPATPIISPVDPSVCPGGVQALTVTNALQGNATLGTGTLASGTSYPNPLSAFYGGAKHQMLYTATELQAQGLGAGSVISSVKFDVAAFVANKACTDFTIRMGTTASTALTGFVAGTTTVYGPTTYTPSATGIVSFTLSAPFTWDGTSNLIVETVHNAGNGGNGSGTTMRYTATTGTNTVYYGYKDNVAGGIAGFDAAAITLLGASPNRPNTIFGYNLGTTTWSPTTDLYTNAGATVAYTGGNAATVYTKPTSTTTYTATNTNLNGCSNTSTTTVTVLPASTLASVSQPVTTCSGQPTTFNLTGLLASSTSTIAYTVNAVAQTPITGVVADASGNGTLVLALAAFTNGQTLAITSITRTDVTPANCATAITANNTATISVQALVTYYADTDGDGFGDNAVTDVTCLGQPVGYVTNNTDCDDTNINIYQFATFYVDADGDGYTAGTASLCSGLAVPSGHSATTSGTDCDDNNIAITVGPQFYADTDGDGFGDASSSLNACTQPVGYVSNNTDCDDTDIDIYQFATFYVDADGDTYGSNATASVCSGLAIPAGYSSTNDDCDDTNAALNPTNPCLTGSVVNLTLFIEGYYSGSSTMASVKLNQDYVSPDTEVEDMTVELHEATFPYDLVETTIATLNTDGTLQATFTNSGSYYIAVKGSNIVQTWTATPQTVSGTFNYDFSSSASQAYGDNMVEVETGVFAFYSGDMDVSDSIDPADFGLWEVDSDNAEFGVFATDLNGDGAVDPQDYGIWEINSDNAVFALYPFE